MHSRFWSGRRVLLSFVLVVLGVLLGCSTGGGRSQGAIDLLRASFPEQAGQVLGAGAGFRATGEGFVGGGRGRRRGGSGLRGRSSKRRCPRRARRGCAFAGRAGLP